MFLISPRPWTVRDGAGSSSQIALTRRAARLARLLTMLASHFIPRDFGILFKEVSREFFARRAFSGSRAGWILWGVSTWPAPRLITPPPANGGPLVTIMP